MCSDSNYVLKQGENSAEIIQFELYQPVVQSQRNDDNISLLLDSVKSSR